MRSSTLVKERLITIRLTGPAARLMEEVMSMENTEQEVIAKALWLLKYAFEGRLAVIRNQPHSTKPPEIETVLSLVSSGKQPGMSNEASSAQVSQSQEQNIPV